MIFCEVDGLEFVIADVNCEEGCVLGQIDEGELIVA
jgi:hypothetical protein